MLRPLYAARPYRLQMDARLRTPKGTDLYAFWGTKISEVLNRQAEQTVAQYLLNGASHEYFGAIQTETLKLPVITQTFLKENWMGPK